MQVDQDSPRISFPPPLIYLGALLGGVIIDRFGGWDASALPDAARWTLATAFLLSGALLILAAAGRFRAARTGIKPWTTAHAIVESGVYRWTRNPMYLGMTLTLAGLALAFNSISALLMVPVTFLIVQTQVIAREERYLEQKFGDTYLRYKAKVRRWI